MDTITLAQQLIRESSITPDDGNCQAIISHRLKKSGFTITQCSYGSVKNLWARRGTRSPLFVFAGHTDVVPPGPLSAWCFPPFEAILHDNKLYGRGAADMKGGIAAMVCAAEHFVAENPDHIGSIAFLITSDEEGPAIDGTARVLDNLSAADRAIDFCVVGEASCAQVFGDTIKIGRRGSLSAKLTILGKQGHIAYPTLADNPIHRALAALQSITDIDWDQGDEHFPPTSLQFSNIHSGTGAQNVIPGTLEAHFNLRYAPIQSVEKIQHCIEKTLNKHTTNYTLEWTHGAEPFITQPGSLTQALSQAILDITKLTPKLSTTGGTSDGRFIAKTGAQVVEFGVCNHSIHQIDEHTTVSELKQLTDVYQKTLENLLLK